MRHIIIVAPLILILFFVLYLFSPTFSKKIDPESFIGQEVLLVVSQHDLADRVDEFSDSPLGRALGDIDYQSVADTLEFSLQGDELTSTKQKVAELFSNPLVKVLFGKEVTCALYPFTFDPGLSFEEQLYQHLLVIARPRHPAPLIDLMGQVARHDEPVAEVQYGTHTIKRFSLDNQRNIAAVRVKDVFLFSLDERLLRQGLDHYDSGEMSLIGDKEYRDNKKQFAGASFYSYLNLEDLYRYTADSLQTHVPGLANRVEQELAKHRGYKDAFFGAWKDDEKIFDKAVITFDKKKVPANLVDVLNSEPAVPATLSRVASDTIMYYWNNSSDLEPLLELLLLQGRENQMDSIEGAYDRLAEITELNSEEIGPLMKNELTMAVKTIPEQQFVPIPYVMFVLKNNDPEKLKSFIEKLIEHFQIPMRRKRINDRDSFVWGGVIGMGSLQPTFTFIDDYLVVASNTEQVEQFIGLPAQISSLDKDERFIQVGGQLVKKNNTVVYMDFAELTTMIKELVSWGGTMVAIKDREVARKSKLLIDQIINPILDGLAMYSIVGTRKYLEKDRIFFETTTVIDNGK